MGPTDAAVDDAVARLGVICTAARNSNHAGEIAAVRAAYSDRLEAALRMVLPEIRHSIAAGDGRFTLAQVAAIDDALEWAAHGIMARTREAA